MYHETTYEEEQRQRRRIVRAMLALAVVLVLVSLGVRTSRELAREQGAATLRESVLRAAIQCCAVEGSYPTSVEYLEDHYGLVVNTRDYQVTYEWLGDNIPPAVVVVSV